MVSLVDRNVVVIGGTSGIGLATAVMAKAQGAKVWAVGRSEDRAASAAENGALSVASRKSLKLS